jgi:hypothetical protein
MTKRIYRPTPLTVTAVATMWRRSRARSATSSAARPPCPRAAIHFDHEGVGDQFVRASYPIALVPVWIQLTLAIVFGTIVAVLLYRTQHRAARWKTS